MLKHETESDRARKVMLEPEVRLHEAAPVPYRLTSAVIHPSAALLGRDVTGRACSFIRFYVAGCCVRPNVRATDENGPL